jgi:hypothetical protein
MYPTMLTEYTCAIEVAAPAAQSAAVSSSVFVLMWLMFISVCERNMTKRLSSVNGFLFLFLNTFQALSHRDYAFHPTSFPIGWQALFCSTFLPVSIPATPHKAAPGPLLHLAGAPSIGFSP